MGAAAGAQAYVSPRTTGILFLVAAALFAFVYFYEIRGEQGREAADKAQQRLFPQVEAEAITSISLTTREGTAARLERRPEGWQLTEPLEFPADEFAADGVAAALAEIASETVFEDPEGAEVYGLDDAAGEVRFTADGQQHVLRTGGKTPMGANSYARVGGAKAVYTVPTYRVSALDKSLDDLRDKRVLSFDRNAIDRIEAVWPDGGVTLEKGEQGWRVVSPLEGPADEVTVDALLSDLSFLRANGFEDDPPSDSEVGLDRPEFQIALIGVGGGEEEEPLRVELAVGRNLDGVSLLVRAAHESLYRIPGERMADFPRELVAYRFKELANFSATDAHRVDLIFRSADGAAVTVTATRGEAGWASASERIQPGKVARLVSELSRLRASGILADSMGEAELQKLGLSPPKVVIAVFGGAIEAGEGVETEQLAEVHIGALQGDRWVIARAADNEMVFTLDYAIAEHVPVSLEAFRNRFVVVEEAGAASGEGEGEAQDELPPPADESP